MTNHMQDVAKMLGVELNEEFKINDDGVAVKLTENGLEIVNTPGKLIDNVKHICLTNLLTGEYSIKRKPWKPKHNEIYFYVYSDGVVTDLEWHNCEWDFANYKLGNCYRTAQEAETNRDKWKAFYASDEVLDV
jgi:hypothetical protein